MQSKIKAYSKQWNLQETELRGVDSCRHHHHRKMMDDKERNSKFAGNMLANRQPM